MANSFFRFKTFTVHQDKCAMKVCTDACVFGAWLASRAVQHGLAEGPMLDVGAGTGLLSLMLAQQTQGCIEAVEIEENAFEQARQNFGQSPWPDRLTAIHADIREWSPASRYDLLFSNPPFYEHDLRSVSGTRNIALHSSALNLGELVQVAKRTVTSRGRFAVLLPFHRAVGFEELAKQSGFFPVERVLLQQTPRHTPFRAMYLCAAEPPANCLTQELVIKKNDDEYTDAFRDLLGNYYIAL